MQPCKGSTIAMTGFVREMGFAPDRIRTCGPLLRRQLLYPLSYGGALAALAASPGQFYWNTPTSSKHTPRRKGELATGETTPDGAVQWYPF